jgi:YidC/Oxa1 family membrane protein insertase
MDTKRLITGMLVIFAIVVGWQAFLAYLAKTNNWTLGPATQPSAATVPSSQPDTAHLSATSRSTGTTTAPTMAAAPPSLPATGLRVMIPTTAPVPQTVTLGHSELDVKAKADYPLALKIDPRGAGVDQVFLNQFREAGGSDEPYDYQQPDPIDPAGTRPLATRSITIDGQMIDLLDQPWTLVKHDENSALYSLEIGSADGAVLTVEKKYQLFPKTNKNKGYEVAVDYTLRNRTDKPMRVATSFNGPTPPAVEPMERDDRQVIAGYWDSGIVKVGSDMVYKFDTDMTSKDLTKNKDGLPILWVGASSVYFDAIVRPVPLKGRLPDYLKEVKATALNPKDPSEKRQAALTLTTNDLTIAPKEALTLPLEVFLAPKKRSLLNSAYYAAAPRAYDGTINTMTSWCAFSWLVDGLVYLLMAFHWIFRDWGLAIIGLVVLVRILLHPITKRSTISMQKMGKMGPEMERIKKKYGDNKDELNKAMMQVYKQQGVAPILGCLPMFLQMPIWIALWDMLRSTFELRQAPFLYGWTWIQDLTQPDRIYTFSHPIHLLFFSIAGINLLPFLLAIAYFYQQKYTPKPLAASPEQEKQQKMMQWMSLLFPIFLYAEPSGLNLYIAASTGVGVWEQKRIRAHIKKQEELEKNQRIIVDAKPTRAKRLGQQNGDEPPVKPRGAFARWIADLQEKANQVKREADRKK